MSEQELRAEVARQVEFARRARVFFAPGVVSYDGVPMEPMAGVHWALAVNALVQLGDLTPEQGQVADALSAQGWAGTVEQLVETAREVTR